MRLNAAVYPFCAVVGQDRAKKALLLHAVNPLLKGVLLAGAPGTGKTTLVQGVAELLPERKRIDIPLTVDEDRLLGELDIAAAVRSGESVFAPGLLAEADGHMVTVDNADLMPERLLKTILTAADCGNCESKSRERSDWKPSRFLLFGTLVPEEGKPMPAMFDRWGLYVRLETPADPSERAAIVSRLLAFDRNPDAFRHKFERETEALRKRVAAARGRLSTVHVSENVLRLAAEIAGEARCPGHRADILLLETARALAAWEGLSETTSHHLREAAGFVLPHRMMGAMENPEVSTGEPSEGDQAREQMENSAPPHRSSEPSCPEPNDARQEDPDSRKQGGQVGQLEHTPPSVHPGDNVAESDYGQPSDSEAHAIVETVGREIDVRQFMFTPPYALQKANAGKRNRGGTGSSAGRYVRAEKPRGPLRDLAFDATFRTAAPYQRLRRERYGPNDRQLTLLIEPRDLRVKVRESRTGTALLFVVDASGSMNAGKRMKAVKGAVLSLLRDAYRQRDSVGLIAFRGRGAELLLGMTRSVELAEQKLKMMPVGGKTPLSAGLIKGLETIRSVSNKGSGLVPAMVVITDGKANVSFGSGLDPWRESRIAAQRVAAAGVRTLVIDTEEGFVQLGYARKLADDLQGSYYRLAELEADHIERAVRTLV